MRKSIWRPKFDPTADFVVGKPFRFGGSDLKRGEPFNHHTSKRQLRIFYEGRFLEYAPTQSAPQSEPEPEPEPTNDSPTRRISLVSKGWYNVLDADGNKLNDKKLRLKEAGELVAQG